MRITEPESPSSSTIRFADATPSGGRGVVVMSVDILPTRPRDASVYFVVCSGVHSGVGAADYSVPFEQLDLPRRSEEQ